MKILVTGACGYKGSVHVPKLLAAGHSVLAFDAMWFGNALAPHPQLEVVRGDVRSPDGISVELLQSGDALPSREPWASMPNTGEW